MSDWRLTTWLWVRCGCRHAAADGSVPCMHLITVLLFMLQMHWTLHVRNSARAPVDVLCSLGLGLTAIFLVTLQISIQTCCCSCTPRMQYLVHAHKDCSTVDSRHGCGAGALHRSGLRCAALSRAAAGMRQLQAAAGGTALCRASHSDNLDEQLSIQAFFRRSNVKDCSMSVGGEGMRSRVVEAHKHCM